MADLTDAIKTSAEGPAKISMDGQSTEEHSLPDQIAAARFVASQQATQRSGLGIKMVKLVPPGAD